MNERLPLARPFSGERALTISSPAIPRHLARPALVPLRLSGREAINGLFEYQLVLQTPDEVAELGGLLRGANFSLPDMVGREISCAIELEGHGSGLLGNQGAGERQINALIAEARLLGEDSRHALYELTLRPWLYLATLSTDCKVFQNQTPVQVLRAVLDDYIFPVEWRLIERYPVVDYLVQYNETDYQFLCRLMQAWGINHHFEHTNGVHRLVLSDYNGAFRPLQADDPDSSYHAIAYYPPGHKIDEEYIHAFAPVDRLTAGAYESREYDHTRPGASLTATARAARPTGQAGQDVYLWRGSQTLGEGEAAVHLPASDWSQPNRGADKTANQTEAQGRHLARLRMDALRQLGHRARGQGHVRGIAAGHSFQLREHPQHAANIYYLTLAADLVVENVSEDTARAAAPKALSDAQRLGGQWRCTVDFEVQPASELLRPEATQPKPHIPGPETALVCGPDAGTAETNLYTDHLGRIKVQFPWDRYGPNTHHSSCWVRVSSEWAGNQLGGMHLPRVGQEVIVSFIGGDIDRPICTGRVYNQTNLPPWELPAQQALSGLRSRELTPGGGNSAAGRSNHLVLDDTHQAIQAQLKSDHQHSSLSLGHITRIEDRQGRKDHRGQGFELRTDGHGAIRAKDGLILSTEARSKATGHVTDLSETIARLNQAQGQHDSLAHLAQMHQAQTQGDQDDVAQALNAQNQGIAGKAQEGRFPELQEPHLILASPAGIESTTPATTHQHSGQHHAISSGGHTSVSAGKSLLASADQAIRLFAYKAGVKLISATSGIELKAVEASIHLLAKLKITATAQQVHIEAKEAVTINGGGSATQWQADGITENTAGTWAAHAAVHGMPGGKSMPVRPQDEAAPYNELLVLRDRKGRPVAHFPYRLTLANGRIVSGVTDSQGRTQRLGSGERPMSIRLEHDITP
ncbi:type VI secretion system tip protein VgrG [Aquincola tertiaricarbonis]|uniref:Type VI secretion system tip protein VgrG n=1 Tax=Aquincola tertiaricarbonis TaxID=391953 RepID=A0ABY4SFB6_AQUTE|nr:type VI secretion system Vgr family protein [Aquincola tertiaricarbonis]URI10845.1 type VI secretion system tip protein VgrG [Aquincola tertiaricarbonis]